MNIYINIGLQWGIPLMGNPIAAMALLLTSFLHCF